MKRRIFYFCILTAALILLGSIGVRQLFRSTESAPPKTDVPQAKPSPTHEDKTDSRKRPPMPHKLSADRVMMIEVTGKVEKRTGEEPWIEARPGDLLKLKDELRTGVEGHAKLAMGDQSEVSVFELSELSIRRISSQRKRLRLKGGRVAVKHGASSANLEIEGKNGQVVTAKRASRFTVSQNESTVAVATTTGVVDLSAAGKTVEIKAGKQASASMALPPTPPRTIPKEVLLKIAGPAKKPLQAGTVMKGQTRPGNRVLVAGKLVPVDSKGRFSVVLRVKPGTKQISVVTEDLLGRRKKRTLKLLAVRSQSPIEKVKVEWKKQQKLDVKWQQEEEE